VIVATPEKFHETWANLFNGGDIKELLSLYKADAALVPAPGSVVSGLDAIRVTLSKFLALAPMMTIEPSRILRAGNIALLHSSWHLIGRNPDGSTVDLHGVTSDVIERQIDGRWLIAIDDPYGTAGM
jgi:uncharacterized protein (TIGR02246 family)